jgi:hypothetical protein
MRGRIKWAGAMVVSAVLAGCGTMEQGPLNSSQLEQLKLREVGEMYRLHQIMAKKPPRSLKDFQMIGDADAPTAYGAVRSGEVVLRWQATLPDTEPEPTSTTSDEVLAYIKTVPEKGGPVLMLDRHIHQMTAEEFKAAKFAGTGEEGSRKSR